MDLYDGADYLTLDLLVVNDTLNEVWEVREAYDWHGAKIAVVSKAGLAAMKRIAGRDQDLLDLKKPGLDDGPTEKPTDE